MRSISACLWIGLLAVHQRSTKAFVPTSSNTAAATRIQRFATVPGADIEQPPLKKKKKESPSTADIEMNYKMRGKVNEIDYCIAPADVSLSRALQQTDNSSSDAPALSLTRALNNASNRAVRRILLSKSWPSAEALNESLRQVAAKERGSTCPVPRPILNVITRNTSSDKETPAPPKPRSRSNEEYVKDQLDSFRNRYGDLNGYSYANDYLECILSLATSGVESPKAVNVLKDKIYDEAYNRVLSVLLSVGVRFEKNSDTGLRAIADKLLDKDICWSVMDKIALRKEEEEADTAVESVESSTNQKPVNENDDKADESEEEGSEKEKRGLKFWKKNKSDLGGVLLSAEEPTMTRQLNILSNVVQRSLLFGGDEELLVLAETLEADRDAFIERWYAEISSEDRPGLTYLDALIQLLRDCYSNGVVETLDPPIHLRGSYANSYERLVASSVELGSGYIKPSVTAGIGSSAELVMPKPRTAEEELERFAVLETQWRQKSDSVAAQSPYPEELEGSWEVRDVIGGETIGTSKITFDKRGEVKVAEPLEGLRWRLDPGPAHLDTCTFQVLSKLDGTILQYRGFIDRGARLESRLSKRPLQIRGSVMFKMREGASFDYYKDIMPINYSTGTTRFVMRKIK